MRYKATALLVILFSSLSFFSGGVWTYLHSQDRARDTYRSLEKFAQVYKLIKQNYVHEPADSDMIDGAIRGMLEELDPHSVYLKAEDFKQMQADTRGEFGGLGIEISKRDGHLTVVSPIEGTPAFEAGILSGDVIAKIEDKPTDNMSTFEAVNLMRGAPGDPITIWIRRAGSPELIDKTIVRAVIQVRTVSYEVKEGFGVIKVRSFVERTSSELRNAIERIKSEAGKERLKGLVLDLRNNPGGLLQQAVEVSDIFLEEGLIVYTQGRDERKVAKQYASKRGTEPSDYPLAVLINGGSASASEIVAGALQDYGRAHIIGTQSFGKGSVQHVVPLDDGSGIKLTVSLYYTPKGRQIQGSGITPDDRVLGPFDVAEMRRERDLPNHLIGESELTPEQAKELQEQMAEQEGPLRSIEELVQEGPGDVDAQLDRAIAYLKDRVKLAENRAN